MEFTKEQAKIMSGLLEADSAVAHEQQDVFSSGLESPSPSFNYCFDNSWMLPYGYSLLLGGTPKGGKSLLISAMFGQLHRTDAEAIVLKYNTEFREKAQVTKAQLALWGIDPQRYRAFETNTPEGIFDHIERTIPLMAQAGLSVRAVAIDSVNDILGRRSMNSETVNQQQIGDEAKTLGDGFKRIKGVLRKYNVSTILSCQVRAEMDVVEQRRGHNIKLAVPWAIRHYAEYFMMVERLQTKAGRTDLRGNEFRDDRKVDLTGEGRGDGEESAHKVRVTMLDSSLGRRGRVGIFTLDHDRGIINTHEEVFLLGTGLKVLVRDGGSNYSVSEQGAALNDTLKQYADRSWRGKEAMLAHLQENRELCDAIIRGCKRLDIDRKNGIVHEQSAEPAAE